MNGEYLLTQLKEARNNLMVGRNEETYNVLQELIDDMTNELIALDDNKKEPVE
jgi:hypothetical protein